MRSPPDILVLGAGGVLGEAWMSGVLAGIEDRTAFDMRRCDYFVGTSAGSVLGVRLAAGERPERPAHETAETAETPGTTTEETLDAESLTAGVRHFAERTTGWAVALSSPLTKLTLNLLEPGGAIARAAMLRTMPQLGSSSLDLRRAVQRSRAEFDGRLRVVAVNRASGRRVVFGQPGAPHASVADAVQASCAVPWLYTPVRIGDSDYVDGGVWSPTNLDVAPAHRGTHVLCLNPTAGLAGPNPMLAVARSTSKAITAIESQVLRAKGAIVHTIGPDLASIAAFGINLMATEPRPRALAAGYRQGLALAERSFW